MNKSYCYSWYSCTLRYRPSKGKGFFVLLQHHARGIVEHGVKFHAFLVLLVNGSDSDSITEMSTRGKGGRCLGLTSPSYADCLEIQGAPTSWSAKGLSRGNEMVLSVHGRSDQNKFPAPNKHKTGYKGRKENGSFPSLGLAP
jgi:hypothetical protein